MGILRETVSRIETLTDKVSEVELDAPPEPGEWSTNVLLAHLRACQDVLGRNITRIVREERPAWRRMSPREWQRKSGYEDWEFRPALEAFATGRVALLAVLDPMQPDDWERVAVVTVPPNRTVEQTARFFGDWLAGHEQVHLEQIARTIRAVEARD